MTIKTRSPLFASVLLAVLTGCGGSGSGEGMTSGPADPAEASVIEDGEELVQVLDGDDLPAQMTGDYLIEQGVTLDNDNAYPWYELLDEGDAYRFCVLNTVTLAWAEFDSTQGGLVDSGADGGKKIGAVCGE